MTRHSLRATSSSASAARCLCNEARRRDTATAVCCSVARLSGWLASELASERGVAGVVGVSCLPASNGRKRCREHTAGGQMATTHTPIAPKPRSLTGDPGCVPSGGYASGKLTGGEHGVFAIAMIPRRMLACSPANNTARTACSSDSFKLAGLKSAVRHGTTTNFNPTP